jgi:hypothetical protein
MNALRYTLVVSVALLSCAIVSAAVNARANNFQEGMRTISIDSAVQPYIYYASTDGNIYSHYAVAPWSDPPNALGNFFFGQPVPSDFLNGLHVVTIGNAHQAFVIYASSTGDVFRQPATSPFSDVPTNIGNFFFGAPVPAAFQAGLQIVNIGNAGGLALYYADSAGDVLVQRDMFTQNFYQSPIFLGNFFNGSPPVKTAPSTIGGLKSKYR